MPGVRTSSRAAHCSRPITPGTQHRTGNFLDHERFARRIARERPLHSEKAVQPISTVTCRAIGVPRHGFTPVTTPTARNVGVWGHCLSALLCLSAGLFLLLLVRFQWIWFLWPLAILAVFVVAFGVLLARSAMVAVNASLPVTNRLKRHTRLQEAAFWTVIVSCGYGLYLLMSVE